MAETGAKACIRAIRKWEPETRRQLRKEMRKVGDEIAAAAKALAAQYSTTIPGTIKVGTRIGSQDVTIIIKAGSASVPIAGLFEHGNKGRAGRKVKFRHPVFGRGSHGTAVETWVNQQMHPYLAPAIYLKLPAVTGRIESAVEKATKELDL